MDKRVLLIDERSIKDGSIIDHNVDGKVLSKLIYLVQDTHLKAILGKVLYNDICNEVRSVNETPGYIIGDFNKELLNKYITPFLIYATLVEFILVNNTKVTNKGMMKMSDNSAQSVSNGELDYFKERYDNYVSEHKQNLINFLAENNLLTCEADTDTTSTSIGWYLEGHGSHVTSVNPSSSGSSGNNGNGSTKPVYATLDITDKTEIDLSTVQHANYITLTSSNPSEFITKIKNYGEKYNEVRFFPEKDLTVAFYKSTDNSTPGVNEIEIPTPTFVADGNYYDWVSFEKINTWSRQIDGMTYGELISLPPTGWQTTGNVGTNPLVNFLGTTDAVGLCFKTDNTERIFIETDGNVGIGTLNPTAKLHIQGIDEQNYFRFLAPYSDYSNSFFAKMSDVGTGDEYGSATMFGNIEEGWHIEATSLDGNKWGRIGVGQNECTWAISNTFDYNAGLQLLHDESNVAYLRLVGCNFKLDYFAGGGSRMLTVNNDGFLGVLNLPSSNWNVSSSNIYNNNGGNVGIGLSSPSFKLHVNGTLGTNDFIYSSNGYVAQETLGGSTFQKSAAVIVSTAYTSGALILRNSTSSNGGNVLVNENTTGTTIKKNQLPNASGVLALSVNGVSADTTGNIALTLDYTPTSRTITVNGVAHDLSANRSWTVGDIVSTGSYSNPAWLTSLAWSKLSGTPTTVSGYGITDSVTTNTSQTITGAKTFSSNITFGTSVYDVSNNRLSFPTSTGTGRLNFPDAGTTAADGIYFGTAKTIFGSASNALSITATLINLNGFVQIPNTSTIQNATSSNRGYITFANPGLILTTNVADANPSVVSQNLNTSSTGDIHQFKFGTTTMAFVARTGAIQSLYHRFGSGSPEGVVTAPVGAYYSRTDGGTGTSLYVKESGTGNTGWVAK